MLKIYISFSLLFYLNSIVSQVINHDSLFQEIKFFVLNKNFSSAINAMKKLNEEVPDNSDYTIYISRLYFWDNQILKSLKTIEAGWEKGNKTEENLRLYIQVLLITKDYIKAVKLSEEGINSFPSEQDYYRLQKGIALEKENKNIEALKVFEEISEKSIYLREKEYSKTQILQKKKNEIGLGYSNFSFSNTSGSSWHLVYGQFKKKFDRISIIGRINYGNLFDENASQAEIDLYPKVGNNSYLYFNSGISDDNSVFPLFRLGGEFYQESKRWSGSLGTRYLLFEKSNLSMFTGHLGRKLGNYEIAYRPFVVAIANEWYFSNIINFRRTNESKESYVQLELQYGSVPYYFFLKQDFTRFNAFRVGFNCRFRVGDNLFIQPIIMYEWEKIESGNFRIRQNIQLNSFIRF